MSNNLFVSFKKVCLEICLFLSKEKADFPWFYQENRPYERAGIRTRDNLIKRQIPKFVKSRINTGFFYALPLIIWTFPGHL